MLLLLMVTSITPFVRVVSIKMKNTKLTGLVLLISLILLLLPSGLALSKPIAGKLIFDKDILPLEVNIYVEVNSLFNGKQICKVNPPVTNGPDGSFASNLNNLVLKDFPTANCNSFWKGEDAIWYEIEFKEQKYSSPKEKIKLGTGLQFLENLNLEEAAQDTENPVSVGSGSGGSGNLSLKTPSENKNIILPEISALLYLTQNKNSVESTVNLELLNDIKSEIMVKVFLFSLPNENIVSSLENNFFIKSKIKEKFIFDSLYLGPGRYQAQAFVYFQEKLIAVSNIEKFFIRSEQMTEDIKQENLAGKAAKQSSEGSDMDITVSLLLLIIVVLVVLLLFKKYQNIKTIRNIKNVGDSKIKKSRRTK